MADGTELARTIVSGLLSGGATAATTFLTVFRSTKSRLASLEERVGSPIEPRSGLFLAIGNVEDALRRLKRTIDDWDDHPPDWAKRLVNRSHAATATDLSALIDLEGRIDDRLRKMNARILALESTPAQANALTREEYLEDSARRAREIGEIREEAAAINGLLRGILVALGTDPDNPRGAR
jgi:hypothetical protein